VRATRIFGTDPPCPQPPAELVGSVDAIVAGDDYTLSDVQTTAAFWIDPIRAPDYASVTGVMLPTGASAIRFRQNDGNWVTHTTYLDRPATFVSVPDLSVTQQVYEDYASEDILAAGTEGVCGGNGIAMSYCQMVGTATYTAMDGSTVAYSGAGWAAIGGRTVNPAFYSNTVKFHLAGGRLILTMGESHADGMTGGMYEVASWLVDQGPQEVTCRQNPSCDEVEYIGINQEMFWQDARDYCVLHHRNMAVIRNAEQNQQALEACELLEPPHWVSGYHPCMIGMSDVRQEGTWEWVTGESVSYTNWMDGQPNEYVRDGGGEDAAYIALAPLHQIGQWGDGNFHIGTQNEVPVLFICEACVCP
jgi:hypothetical protein